VSNLWASGRQLWALPLYRRGVCNALAWAKAIFYIALGVWYWKKEKHRGVL